ncbi:MAG: cyclic nucleotide-binding domain-containing protein [Bacteriovoracaceae bacterium]|jgi:CRP/FNR family transcriptional regulator, cyclic AMP receptor protein|nr:cyclic nucleotide-binding domain-containing protein [Bacteriovoracaceae bacterium]
MSKMHQYLAGDVVIREGEESTSVFFVKEGLLGVYKRRGTKEIQVGTIKTGEVVGEMSFFDKEPRCATVKAIQASVVNEVESSVFKSFFKGQPKWHQNIVLLILQRIRRTNLRARGIEVEDESGKKSGLYKDYDWDS